MSIKGETIEVQCYHIVEQKLERKNETTEKRKETRQLIRNLSQVTSFFILTILTFYGLIKLRSGSGCEF